MTDKYNIHDNDAVTIDQKDRDKMDTAKYIDYFFTAMKTALTKAEYPAIMEQPENTTGVYVIVKAENDTGNSGGVINIGMNNSTEMAADVMQTLASILGMLAIDSGKDPLTTAKVFGNKLGQMIVEAYFSYLLSK